MAATMDSLPIGDSRRKPVGRAVHAAFLAGGAFVVFSVLVKDVRALAAVAPWTEDPYDAFVSFGMFFVPVTVALSLVRLVTARADRPLPLARVHGLLRATHVVLATVLATCAMCWISVVAARPGAQAPAGLLAALAVVSALGLGALGLTIVGSRSLPEPGSGRPDWLDDLPLAMELSLHRAGASGERARRAHQSFERVVAPRLRRHVGTAELAVGVAFGAFVAAGAMLEGDPPVLVALLAVVGATAMLAFVAFLASYLRLVAPAADRAEPRHRPRPTVLAAVVAAAAIPVALAFRGALWWLVGTTDEAAGIPDLARLLAATAIGAFLVARLLLWLVATGRGRA